MNEEVYLRLNLPLIYIRKKRDIKIVVYHYYYYHFHSINQRRILHFVDNLLGEDSFLSPPEEYQVDQALHSFFDFADTIAFIESKKRYSENICSLLCRTGPKLPCRGKMPDTHRPPTPHPHAPTHAPTESTSPWPCQQGPVQRAPKSPLVKILITGYNIGITINNERSSYYEFDNPPM